MQELSQWFNLSEQKPWQVGVYELKGGGVESSYSWFNGVNFMYTWDASFGIEQAFDSRFDNDQPSWFPEITHWRGLSSCPSKPAPSPKPRGNRRVTRYVVTESKSIYYRTPVAVFDEKPTAQEYLKQNPKKFLRIEPIRFRTPEASQA